ncbi:type III secretion protein [Salmonella enterica]|nr:type III secretion protein [Salmonella enterica]
MLTKLRRLNHRSKQIQAGCLAALQDISRKDDMLRRKEELIDEQLEHLRTLETLSELQNEVVSRAQIFSVLRKIAVICQRRIQLEFERGEAVKQRQILATEREEQLSLRKKWWIKEQKYEHLRKKVLREWMQQQLFVEEVELEDKYNETNRYNKG